MWIIYEAYIILLASAKEEAERERKKKKDEAEARAYAIIQRKAAALHRRIVHRNIRKEFRRWHNITAHIRMERERRERLRRAVKEASVVLSSGSAFLPLYDELTLRSLNLAIFPDEMNESHREMERIVRMERQLVEALRLLWRGTLTHPLSTT